MLILVVSKSLYVTMRPFTIVYEAFSTGLADFTKQMPIRYSKNTATRRKNQLKNYKMHTQLDNSFTTVKSQVLLLISKMILRYVAR